MKSNYRRLGEYIRQVDIRNKDLKISRLLGVSISKSFIESIANTVGTDFSNYKVVRKRQFAYGPVTSRNGEKVSIALLEEDECIISSSYIVFEVVDVEKLLPEYLMLWFSRPEFDRYARYKSHGSVREIFDWNELCDVQLPILTVEEQKSIVIAYKAVKDRIKLKERINNNLAHTLDALFNETYESLDADTAVNFEKLCSLASSKRVFAEDYCIEGVPFYRGKEITQKKKGEPISEPLFISNSHYEILKANYGVPQTGDILITAVGTIGNSYMVREEDFYFKDGNIIWLKNFVKEYINYYLYDYMQTSIFQQELEGICIGSTQTALTIVALSKLELKVPNDNVLKRYCEKSIAIRNIIWTNNIEIERLTLLTQIILSSLSR